ncbi:MAG: competence/damage-inducible protein A, partial [Deltaproteobacteria bacterium]|nr:competence/damage-inducible protein A [Deltaproteobacteria bacterium]
MTRADAWIVTIGDELLRGEIVDSNKSFFSDRLLRLDLESARHVSVPDDPAAIEEVLREAASRARVVLVSGGLGPTRDDITTEVAARAFGRRLLRDAVVLKEIRAFFHSLGREMAANNAKQADFPEGAEVLSNPLGTAPGFMLQAEGALLFFTPGVPRELQRMTDEEILPRIRAKLGRGGVVRALLLRTFGLGESTLDHELRDLARSDPDVTLGFRTQFPDNLVRVLVRAADEAEAEKKLRDVVDRIHSKLGELVLGEGERPLEEIVGELLRERHLTLAVAESCTGGLLTSRITDVPGSSQYLVEAVVSYADESKVRELGVSAADLKAHGAVSEPVAQQMAEGVRRRAGTDLGLATTGIAGPGGGSPEKPVGTVCVALSDAEGTVVRRYQLMRDRTRNK